MLSVLNMTPPVQCQNKSCFLMLWLLERVDPQSFAYVLAKSPIRREDGDAKVL